MPRYRTKGPVEIPGTGVFGRKTSLSIRPTAEPGIWWETKSGETVLVGKGGAKLRASDLLHCLILEHKGQVLRVPEHLFGYLYASCLDGICFSADRLPYDGSARAFEEGVKPLIPNGRVACYTPTDTVRVETSPGVYVEIIPDSGFGTLNCEVEVDYPGIGSYTLEGRLFDDIRLEELLHARSHGRSAAHRILWQALEKEDRYVWFEPGDTEAVRQVKLREIALHRLLDLIGALLCACPAGGRIIGKIRTRFAGHTHDIRLVKEIERVGLRPA